MKFLINIIYIPAFLTTYAGVELFRRLAIKKSLFDLPNERSSHQVPTPRGGGIAVVIVILFLYPLYCLIFGQSVAYGYLAAILMLAAVGFYDDLKTVPFGIRIIIQAFAASLIIWQNGFLNEIYIPFAGNINTGWCGLPFTFLWILGVTNAYNFMDGIDGIAAVQSVIAGLGWLVVGNLLNSQTAMILGGLSAFSAYGFYLHNRSPAKIFMGDVGSTFYGFTFAVLPILIGTEVHSNQNTLFLTGLLLLWFFVFDTSQTLFRRLFKREKFWQAHRQHLYQKLVKSGCSHNSVTLLYGASALCVGVFPFFGVFLSKTYFADGFFAAAVLSFGIFLYEKRKSKGFCV